MAHRFVALTILVLVARSVWLANRQLGQHPLAKISFAWLCLIIVQVFLGAATIWTGKSADVATAHVAAGALSLMTGMMLINIAFRCLVPVTKLVETVPAKVTQFAGQAGTTSNARG
jgi:heme a synthase